IEPGRNPENVSSAEVSVSSVLDITDDWQHVKIPLQAFLSSSTNLNLNQMFTIGFSNTNMSEMTFWLNDIKFTSPNNEPGFAPIKLNQLGYLPQAQKIARVSGFGEELIAQVGTPFEIRSLHNNEVAYRGELELGTEFDEVVSGERVLIADFSPLTNPGNYYLAVSAHRMEDSSSFQIGGDIYDRLLADSLRYFYLQRSGMALEERYAGKFARGVGHAQDAQAEFRSGIYPARDVAGGWYDAGDYGKYVNAGATSISDLLWAYEIFPEQLANDDFSIPESSNSIPDLLDEIRWELDWILKMQDVDSGGFYHMVQPTENVSIENAQDTRFIEDVDGNRENVRPTSTTGSAVAALAHAAYIFKSVDPDYADKLLAAAEHGWAYLDANPDGVAPVPGPYSDEDDSDDRFWAATALYRATGDSVYHDAIKQMYRDVKTYFDTEDDNAYGVGSMGMVAWLLYAYSDDTDPELMAYFEDLFIDWLARMEARWQDSVWDLAMLDEDFYWGSNYVTLTTPLVMLVGSQALNLAEEPAITLSQDALDYLLGTNPMSFSYISGFGENSLKNPFSQNWSNDGILDVPDGIMAGGPNAYSNPLIYSNFAGKRYVDSAASWTTNEHTIYWNSTLVFHAALAAMLGQQQPVTSTPGEIESVPTATPFESPDTNEEFVEVIPLEDSSDDASSNGDVSDEIQASGDVNDSYRMASLQEDVVELQSSIANIQLVLLGMGIVLLITLIMVAIIFRRSTRERR
ncbi:MAG: glycoside hydrolase family 9 protein, partial [Anaerolineales bacterium]